MSNVKLHCVLAEKADSACNLPTKGVRQPMPMSTFSFLRSGLTALLLLILTSALGQQANSAVESGRVRYDEPRFRMGLHFLPSVSWFDTRDSHTASEGTVARFGFGFTADIMFADNYAVGTGLNVFRNGGKLSYYDRVTGDPTDLANDSVQFLVRRERTLTQHWVELPVTLKFRTRQIGHITYWGQFGLGLGLNLRSTASDRIDYRYRGEDGGEDGLVWTEETAIAADNAGVVALDDVATENDVALIRAAMIVGVGIEYNLSGKTALLLGATFNNGLFNVSNNRNYGESLGKEHLQPALDGSLDPAAAQGYKIKMVDNAILLSCGLLF
jgi:hypothetical protein